MLRHVALVRTDVSEELSASIRVTRIGEPETTLAVTSNRRTLRRYHGRNRHDSGDAVARGSLPHLARGTASLQTKRTQNLFSFKKDAMYSSETSVFRRAI
jgi:hypothetical protein